MDVKRGYKQTEVGVIPADWQVKSVREFSKVTTGPFGTLLKASEYSIGDGVPLISVGEIRSGYLHISEETPRVSSTVTRRIPQYLLNYGDIVFGRKGGVDRSAMIQLHQNGWFLGSDGISIRPFHDGCKVYLAFQLQSNRIQGWLLQNAIGTTMPSLNQEILRKVLIPFPPTLAEQQAIATALGDADALIESLEQLLAKKRQIKQGAMQDLLTGNKRLPGFEGEWEVKRLGSTAMLKARIGWQGLTTAEYQESGEYFLVTGTEFQDGRINWDECHFVDENRYKQDKYIQLRAGDVLVTKDGTIGKVAFVESLPRPSTLNSGVFVIRSVEGSFLPKFFYYLLSSCVFREFLDQLSAGSTINHLYQKDFVSFTYATPPTIDEQLAIATILSDMDTEIGTLEDKLAKARNVKAGMMQELLTGRIRLV